MIDPKTYDGEIHAIPFTVGADFTAKLEAYKADGFSYCLLGAPKGCFLVQKVMRS